MPAVAPKPRGIFCPVCQTRKIRCVNRRYPASGLKVRYYRCMECKTRFTGDERLGKVIVKKPTPAVK